ncbi:hypothetical protein ZWY2020_059086 [Hordeum vulgare]|nr:hypothetical protein ZWY2020_059086 [Hordeum vulgare]
MAASPSLHAPRLLPLLSNPAPSLVRPRRWPRRSLTTMKAQAVPPSRNGSSAGTDWCPMPPEQRPVNEYGSVTSPSSPGGGDWFHRSRFLHGGHLRALPRPPRRGLRWRRRRCHAPRARAHRLRHPRRHDRRRADVPRLVLHREPHALAVAGGGGFLFQNGRRSGERTT